MVLVFEIPEIKYYDDDANRFFTHSSFTLKLEHSLISISKWEAKWCKPFLSEEKKSKEEGLDYLRQMTISPPDYKLPTWVYKGLPKEVTEQIFSYIEEPRTATTFSKKNNSSRSRETITSELIYYWMVANQIPFECERWHLNRLLTLINVCVLKNTPTKKMSKRDLLSRNAKLNRERRAKLNTTG